MKVINWVVADNLMKKETKQNFDEIKSINLGSITSSWGRVF